MTEVLPGIHFYKEDLPKGIDWGASVAVDCEMMGLNPQRDRLCLVQIAAADGTTYLVQIMPDQNKAPNLTALLTDKKILKIFHYGRGDMGVLQHAFGVMTAPVYCTKIVSRLVRTYTDRHGLKDICRELLSVDLSKQQQTSDWGAPELTPDQMQYAATDVQHLHALKAALDERLKREGREELAAACFSFLPYRVTLDLAGWPDQDIFAHS